MQIVIAGIGILSMGFLCYLCCVLMKGGDR